MQRRNRVAEWLSQDEGSTIQGIIPYITDHQHSRVVIAAAAEGLHVEPRLAAALSWTPEPSLVYGILRGCQDIIRKCRSVGVDWWHIDLGYFDRGHYDGYYRLSRNGLQAANTNLLWLPSNRKFPAPAPWNAGNGPIVICPPTVLFSQNHPFEKLDENDWTDSVIRALEGLTDRPHVIRVKKAEKPLPPDPWCVIVHSSNIAIDVLRNGTPVIALGESVVKEYGPRLAQIEDYKGLRSTDRETMFAVLAHAQFTLDEFRSGYAFELSKELQG